MGTVLAVNPPIFTMSTREKLPFSFDTTLLLQSGEVPITPTVFVTQLDNNASTPGALSGGASISGNLVQQTILGSGLQAGKSYRIDVTFLVSSTKIWSMELTLVCVY